MEHGRTVSFTPAVAGLLDYKGNGRGKRVLVVGSGCGGLGAAWHLNRTGWDVTLKEADSRFGGHANTIAVDGTEVDTGFMVYNSLNYPNLIALFDELGIEGLDTDMGFSVSLDNGKFEWCGDSLNGLMATSSNAINPAFYCMMRDILRFNTEALKALSLPEHHPTRSQTVGEFIAAHKLRYHINSTSTIRYPSHTSDTSSNQSLSMTCTYLSIINTTVHRLPICIWSL